MLSAPQEAGSGGSGDALETRAVALYLDSEYQAAVEAFEQAHSRFRGEGNAIGAARAARLLAWIHGNVIGDWAVQQGWIGRARTVLQSAAEETAEHGWLTLIDSLDEPDQDRQRAGFRSALATARRTGDPDLEFEALGWLGLLQVFGGQVQTGMTLLDETLAAVCAGDVTDLAVIEGTFCAMLWACEVVQDVSRAEQWIRAAEEYCRRRELPAMTSFCRAHYGAILTAAGRWPEAEVELSKAVQLAAHAHTRLRGNALARLADLRVRQGRLEEAGQLLKGLDRFPGACHPLASLHLARGEAALARAVLDRGLAPGPDTATDGALLALLVDVCLYAGDRGTAGRAADRLEQLSAEQPEPCLRAHADLARGRILAAGGSARAVEYLDRAVTGFGAAQMPLELARARFELATALVDERPDVALAEARSALDTFEDLGANRLADATAELLRSHGASVRTGRRGRESLTKREAEVLRLLAHGLSNPEISDRLFISRKTVEHHVSSILAKLQLRSRAEAAGYAARQTAGEEWVSSPILPEP